MKSSVRSTRLDGKEILNARGVFLRGRVEWNPNSFHLWRNLNSRRPCFFAVAHLQRRILPGSVSTKCGGCAKSHVIASSAT